MSDGRSWLIVLATCLVATGACGPLSVLAAGPSAEPPGAMATIESRPAADAAVPPRSRP